MRIVEEDCGGDDGAGASGRGMCMCSMLAQLDLVLQVGARVDQRVRPVRRGRGRDRRDLRGRGRALAEPHRPRPLPAAVLLTTLLATHCSLVPAEGNGVLRATLPRSNLRYTRIYLVLYYSTLQPTVYSTLMCTCLVLLLAHVLTLVAKCSDTRI